jgi:hypothetical protein
LVGFREKEISMKTMKYCLIAGLALGFPLASAHADDASYCEALANTYRQITTVTNTDAAEAIAQCKTGNTKAGIPTLEKILKENKATLPPRT